MADIFEERAKLLTQPIQTSPPADLFEKRAKELIPSKQERGFIPSFKAGTQGGVSGLITGHKAEPLPEDASWLEQLGSMAGKFVSDYPAMMAGAEAGALGGGALGSIVPGIGTGVGGLVGAGAGAMALPAAIDKSFEEYHDYAAKGGEGSFGDFLERAGRVAKETGQQAAIGGVTGIVSKALPFLKKIPGFDKLLGTNVGRKLATTGMEYGALTLGQAAVEGRSPTTQEAVNNALLLAGLKSTGAAGELIKGKFPNISSKIIKNHPLVKPYKQMYKMLPESGKKFLNKMTDFRQSTDEKMYFSMLKDHVGEKNAKIIESQFKWRNALDKAQSQEEFTPKQLEEMIYYRQKTGNPKVKGDTYIDVASRLPEAAKKFVDEVVGPHIEESLKQWNDNPLTSKINPREALDGIYLPGLYEYEPGKFEHAYNEVSKKFKTKNPFSNPKKFLTYMEAFEKAGLKPRYKNIVDIMRAFDNTNIKVLSNLEFLNQIKGVEKAWAAAGGNFIEVKGVNDKIGSIMVGPKKLIVNSTKDGRRNYDLAKKLGYVPFYDPFLRRYIAGTKTVIPDSIKALEGSPAYDDFIKAHEDELNKPIWATTAAPALVHPDLAPAIQGVFRRDPYKTPNIAAKAYDDLSNELRFIKVALSPFHYASLFMHTGGALGAKKALQSVAPWYTPFKAEADALLNNKAVMMDAARSGLEVYKGIEQIGERPSKIDKIIEQLADRIPTDHNKPEFIKYAADKLGAVMDHLFKIHHPRLKITTWKEGVDRLIAKEGQDITPRKEKAIKHDMADYVNNIYGGQVFETMRFLNNPNNLNNLRRVIQFPDWTLSAIRAADVGLPGGNTSFAQKEARRFWLKYGLFLGATHGLMKWFNSGLTQTDPDESISGIRFDITKAFEGLNPNTQDPKNWYKIPLPNVPVKIADTTYNAGKDENGRRRYMQVMKSALELGHWVTNPFVEFFRKSNPLIQAAWKQIMENTPTEDGTFPVQAEKSTGYKPWGGTKAGTLGRFQARAKELASEFQPFSVGTLSREGLPAFIASGGGAASVSKGLSLTASEPYIEKAISSNNVSALNNIKNVLKDNGYNDTQIKRVITKARHALKE